MLKPKNPRAATKAILEVLIKDGVVDAAKCQYGITKIFLRAKIEEAREKIGTLIPVIQAWLVLEVTSQENTILVKKREKLRSLRIPRLELKNSSWFRLYQKIKPRIKITNWEEQIEDVKKQEKIKTSKCLNLNDRQSKERLKLSKRL